MEYWVRYGLEFNPFLKNAKEIFVETAETKETICRLDLLAQTKGFGLLTGGPGRGKTTTVRTWAEALNPALYKVVYSGLSTLTVNDFYRNLAAGLGTEPAFRKPDNFRHIQEEINRLALEKRKTPVIIMDEADHMDSAVLNDLKILFNFEMDSRDRAIVLMVGLPRLNTKLRLSMHEPVRQRLVMNYNIEGLKKEDGRRFIEDKLKGAGSTFPVFDEAAMEAILNAADGTPRMIAKLCTAGMIAADSRELRTVTADAAMQAIHDCELG